MNKGTPGPNKGMNKEPLIFLPGLLCDADLWTHQIDTLKDMAEISVADLAGPDSMRAMAERVLERAPDRFQLAGLSMGGYVSFEIMRLAPERVTRLALLDTSPLADKPEQTELRKTLIKLVDDGRFDDVMPRLMPKLLHPDNLQNEPLKGRVRRMAKAIGGQNFKAQQRAIMGREDSLETLGQIRCPTLVLCGRQDALTPLDLHHLMADGISDARLVVIEDAGHLSSMEQPSAVSAVLRYWLQA